MWIVFFTIQHEIKEILGRACFNCLLLLLLHLHVVIYQVLLSKATYNWGVHKAINLEEANIQRKCQ